jgi:hypothetical protein
MAARHATDTIDLIAIATGMRRREVRAFRALIRDHEAGYSASDFIRTWVARAYRDRHASRDVRLAKCGSPTRAPRRLVSVK